MWSVQQCATLACLLEVTAPKPGNVHRGADFNDTTFLDFVVSGVAIGPAMGAAAGRRVGQTVLDAVGATRKVTSQNTNLGIVLLMSPLAAVPPRQDLASGIEQILRGLTPDDAADVYAAIRLAQPGGLGTSEEFDVAQPSPEELLQAMALAAERDLVAQQYVSNFDIVLNQVAPCLEQSCQELGLVPGIVHAFVQLLSCYPDSLIARKCGVETATHASIRAKQVLDAGAPDSLEYERAIGEMDFWLRSDGNRRNPGTSADLITAGLFVLLRDRRISLQ